MPSFKSSHLLPLPSDKHASATHSCLEILEELPPCPSNVQEGALHNPTFIWFTDGSSFLHEGVQRAGHAIVSLEKVVESGPLPNGTTIQQAELIALTSTFTLTKGESLTIYTGLQICFLHYPFPCHYLEREGLSYHKRELHHQL